MHSPLDSRRLKWAAASTTFLLAGVMGCSSMQPDNSERHSGRGNSSAPPRRTIGTRPRSGRYCPFGSVAERFLHQRLEFLHQLEERFLHRAVQRHRSLLEQPRVALEQVGRQ